MTPGEEETNTDLTIRKCNRVLNSIVDMLLRTIEGSEGLLELYILVKYAVSRSRKNRGTL